MGSSGTEILSLPISVLVAAPWNYKTDGTPEQIEKLKASIEKDASAGVPAVREIGQGLYEVIDGNHRLAALRELGWEEVVCENFGVIKKSDAVLISRRRNHQWFSDDVIKYAKLFTEDVLPEFSLDQLQSFMPDTREELENISKLLTFDWSQFDKADKGIGHEGEVRLSITLTEEQGKLWQRWMRHSKAETDAAGLMLAVELAMHRDGGEA